MKISIHFSYYITYNLLGFKAVTYPPLHGRGVRGEVVTY